MSTHPVMANLVARFADTGLSDFFVHKYDWNETIIRQFYPTLKIDVVEEILIWMTGIGLYQATFTEFAAAIES